MSRTTRRVRVLGEGRRVGDAFTRTRLMPTFGFPAALSVEHHRPQAGNVQQKGLLKVQKCVFRVFRVEDFSVGF